MVAFELLETLLTQDSNKIPTAISIRLGIQQLSNGLVATLYYKTDSRNSEMAASEPELIDAIGMKLCRITF